MVKNIINRAISIFLIGCWGCVPVMQQVADQERSEIEGFVGTTVTDEDKFYRVASSRVYDRMKIDDQLLPWNNNVTYEGTFDGGLVYIRNCKCLRDPEIVQDKLVVQHTYGGGESNRESTYLLWNGKHYKNRDNEYVVDLILHSDKIDMRRALLQEIKVLDVEALKLKDTGFIWINLLGYDHLIKYAY